MFLQFSTNVEKYVFLLNAKLDRILFLFLAEKLGTPNLSPIKVKLLRISLIYLSSPRRISTMAIYRRERRERSIVRQVCE